MRLTRRELLVAGLGLTAAGCTSTTDPSASSTTFGADPATTAATTTTTLPTPIDAPSYDGPAEPFSLGVASGDPDTTSVVLWTRLVAEGLVVDADYVLAVDIARDESFSDLVSSSAVDAPAQYGHSVHALADGLEPDSWYWYRFRAGSSVSTVGRTRTMPIGSDTPLRFGFSSCQNWESGAYAAHGHLAEADLDLFVWLGDYIYEYGPNNQGVVTAAGARVHASDEIETLDAYRSRYAQYRSDPNLQAHHAARPWIVTWDDHEVDNNHAGVSTEDGQDPAAFAERQRVAHQAWWEHMPVRLDPPTDRLTIYRSLQWGSLLDLHMLDGRQYRSAQPTDGEPVALPVGNFDIQRLGPTTLDPQQSMLGADQRQWLEAQVAASTATWNVLGNQVYMHGLNVLPGESPAINPDSWDGYFAERKELLAALSNSADNLVVLTGDFHSASVGELRTDPFALDDPVIGAEFMAPAISSRFPPDLVGLAPLVLGVNAQIRHFEPRNGFMTCDVNSEVWTTTLHVLDDVTSETSPVSVAATIVVNAGTPGISGVTIS